MLSFFQNGSPPFSVYKITEGMFLDRAIEESPDVFFQCWMQKKIRKAPVGTWFILHEDNDFIYWGNPRFRRLFSDKRIVEEFFKTNKKQLDKQFPDYRTKDGNSIRLKLCEYIKDANKNLSYVTVSMGFKAKLSENSIAIETACYLTSNYTEEDKQPLAKKAKYKIRLDKNSLDLIELIQLNI